MSKIFDISIFRGALILFQGSFFVFFLFFNSFSNAFGYENDQLVEIYDRMYRDQKIEWKALLHYKNNKSVVTDRGFFLSEDGYENPKNEFIDNIQSFLSDDNKKNICRFPARYLWIKNNFPELVKNVKKPRCLEFEKYLTNINAKKIKLVFASENVNNIISMMGHLFIKIEGEKDGKKVEHSLGYFANFNAKNVVSFIVKSLSIGAKGAYLLEPYDKSIEKYNNEEKRSLWEYELELSEEEIRYLTYHIWEMKGVMAKYKFVSHNCGSALLYLMAIFDQNIIKNHDNFDAPIDIVKNMKELGYIKKADILPADNYNFRMVENNFSFQDKVLIKKIIKNSNFDVLEGYSSHQKAKILEGLKIILNYYLVDEKISRSEYEEMIGLVYKKQKLLEDVELKYEVKNPLKKTKSSTLEIGYKNRGGDRDLVNFNFYPVYKDLMEDSSGYFSEFELKLANFEGGYYQESEKLRLDNFDLIEVKNIIPHDYLVGGISGGFKINLERQNFDSRSNKLFPNVNFGAGLASDILSNNLIFYSLFNVGYSYFNSEDVFYSNPEIGIIFNQGNIGKMNISYMKYFSDNDYKYEDIFALSQAIYLFRDVDLLFSYKKIFSDFARDFDSFESSVRYHY